MPREMVKKCIGVAQLQLNRSNLTVYCICQMLVILWNSLNIINVCCCVHLDVIVSFFRPLFLSLFHFLLSFLVHLIDIHAHLSTSQSLLIRTIGTILYNKITKLVYRRINCTLYEYVWCKRKKTKEMIFFSSFNSLSIYFIPRWLVSKRLGCANCLVQFCWISCSVHSDSFNTNTYSSAALISNAVFGSNIICTFCFYSFHSCIFPQTLRNEQSLFVVDWKSSQLIISVIAWPCFDACTVRVLQRQWDSVMMQSIAFARG